MMNILLKTVFLLFLLINTHKSFALVDANLKKQILEKEIERKATLLSAQKGNLTDMNKVTYSYTHKNNLYKITAQEYITFIKRMVAGKRRQGYFMLADEYKKGTLINKDYKKSFELYTATLSLPNTPKHSKAYVYDILATFYRDGIFVQKNDKKYIELLDKAANLGNIVSLQDLAVIYSIDSSKNGLNGIKQDYKKSFNYWQRMLKMATKKEDDFYIKAAHDYLGYFYSNGFGVKKNEALAAQHYEQAANLGSSYALSALSDMHLHGIHYPQNTDKSIALLEKAIKKNNINAVLNLTELYIWGIYVPQDIRKAETIYKDVLAAKISEHDSKLIKEKLQYLYKEYPALLPEYEHTKKELQQKAKLGDADAIIELATMYKQGLAVPKDLNKSIKLLSGLVEKGNVIAISDLSALYKNHTAEYPNMQQFACDLQAKAAEMGDPLSKLFIASDYQNDDDCYKKNLDKAIEYAENLFNTSEKNLKPEPIKYRDLKINAALILEHNYFIKKNPNYLKSFKYAQYLIKENPQQNEWFFYHQGYMYEHGLGTKKDIAMAIKMYKISSKKGSQLATDRLKQLIKTNRKND